MRSKRFRPIVKHAQRLEQNAARALGEAQRRVSEAQQRLDQLCDYRCEYTRRFSESGNQGLGVDRLMDYQAFLDKLNIAIAQQQQHIAKAEQALQQCRDHWFAQRGRSKLLDNVLERYVESEMQQASKKEQREIDDRGTRPSWPEE